MKPRKCGVVPQVQYEWTGDHWQGIAQGAWIGVQGVWAPKRSAKKHQYNERKRIASGEIPSKAYILPVKMLEFRVAKYDVALREAPLWATLAMHTILSRMVKFRCTDCNERFATCHPAYTPPDDLDMHILGRPKTTKGRFGPPSCSTEVATWMEVPPFKETEEELIVAKVYEGRCRVCALDIKRELERCMVETEESIVPLRSWKNRMDPCWNFPHQELRALFQHATLNESMFLALEHMQVDYVTVRTSRLDKFRKNVISFPQDMWSFAQREGMLQHYKVEDRVNSVRGPGSDPDRVPMLARDAPEALRQVCKENALGRLVFPATVEGSGRARCVFAGVRRRSRRGVY